MNGLLRFQCYIANWEEMIFIVLLFYQIHRLLVKRKAKKYNQIDMKRITVWEL